MARKSKWGCKPEHKQAIIRFALDLEENEDRMGDGAAMALTCEQYGISVEEGFDWLLCLPDSPNAWWLEDERLTPSERKELIIKAEAQHKDTP